MLTLRELDRLETMMDAKIKGQDKIVDHIRKLMHLDIVKHSDALQQSKRSKGI
jgi:hypothetical protein